jgi:signal transduction histidine kinase
MSFAKRFRALLKNSHFWVVVAGLAITTWLHYTTSPLLFERHTVYRYLYFLPVVYAALRFGLWGGLLSGLAASLLFAPHIWLKFGHFPEESLNDLFVAVILTFVGLLTGALTDAERSQRRKQEVASTQLAHSLAQLEQRTAALEEMQRYISSVLASLSCGVITVDAAGRVTTDNPMARTLLGSNLVGQPLPAALLDQSGSRFDGYHQLPLAGRSVGVHARPLTSGDGRQMGTVLVLDDLTEVKALEEQVQRAERLSALGTLAGGVAHEVRNPVGIIRASAQLMGSLPAVAEDGDSQEYLHVITQEADRVDRLIEDLLGYARAGELSLAPVAMEDLVRSTAARLASLAEQAEIGLAVQVDPELPQVEGDVGKLEQALLNLGLNAIAAIQAAYPPPDGGGRLSFHVEQAPGGLSCVVSDNGQGMPDEVCAHIFDPFFTTRDDGTGLGLAIVQRIVADHGGAIEVASEPGHGATFTLWLPAAS